MAPDRDPTDGRVATFALFGMMNWIYTWYRPEKDVSVDRLTATILQIFLGGCRHFSSDGKPRTSCLDSRWKHLLVDGAVTRRNGPPALPCNVLSFLAETRRTTTSKDRT